MSNSKNKNYLDDSHGNRETWEEIIKTEIKYGLYKDPDRCSEQLYEDMKKFIEKQKDKYKISVDKKEIENNPYKIVLKNLESKCTIDYIGPSRKQRYKCIYFEEKDQSEKEYEIIEILKETRVLGGHIFWPVKTKTKEKIKSINQYKGTFKDRIDIILHLIREYYEKEKKLKKNKESEYADKILENNKEFFDLFGNELDGFKKFIEFNCLEGFVDVENEYKVYNLFESNLKDNKYLDGYSNSNEEDYNDNWEIYKVNMLYLIHHRNKKMWDIIK